MAMVIGPNGVETYVPDQVAKSLVGDGSQGYAYAPEKKAPDDKPVPRKRTTRKPRAAE